LDEKHPEHDEIKAWAKEQGFEEYDPKRINDIIKNLSYKKTEWDNINHDRYKIIKDKYRKNH